MRTATFLLCALCMAPRAAVPFARDTLLFEILLNEDTTSLRYCAWGGEISRTLSGPVIMAGRHLLFYCENGYLLFDASGAIVDSHAVFDENRGMAPDDPGRVVLAQPIGPSRLLYFRRTASSEAAPVIYEKRLQRKRLKELKDEEYAKYAGIVETRVFNLAHNSRTDEMSAKGYLKPQLVGFDANKEASEWWTLDKFYSFSSPLIHEKGGSFTSFFPGIKASVDENREVKRDLVEPLATYARGGRQYYVGVYVMMGTTEERYSQTLYVCDEAGNILHVDTLLKQTNTDVVIGEDKEAKMLYTARQTARYVFQPAVGPDGTVFYGTIDFEGKKIEVRQRTYFAYEPSPTEPNLAHLIDLEKGVSFEPLALACSPAQQGGSQVPKVTITDEKGRRRTAIPRDLTKSEFIVRILRQQYRDVEKKLARRRLPLPEQVHAARDSLSKESTAGCPYAISLSGPKGILRTFDYASGEQVLCARVVAVRDDKRVLVRVDLEEYAEILVFTTDGGFVDRFAFNRQHYTRRSDFVVAAGTGPIIELDHESNRGGAYFRWAPVEQRAWAGR